MKSFVLSFVIILTSVLSSSFAESNKNLYEKLDSFGDVFDSNLASKLRSDIYSMGSTEEAMDLFVKFRGRKPVIEPLLKVRGLDGSE